LFLQVCLHLVPTKESQFMATTGNANLSGLVAAGLLCLSAGSLYGWSGLSMALTDRFALGATGVGEVFSVAILAFTTAVLLSARMPARLRGLGAAVIAGGVGAGATTLAALAPSYLMFLVSFGLGFGAASGVIYTASLDIASETAAPARTVPAMVALFGLGGALFGAGMRVLVNVGQGLWSIWPVTVALVLASAFGLLVLWRAPPVGCGTSASSGLPARLSVTRRTVAGLWVLFALAAAAGLMCLGLALTILADRAPHPRLAAAAVFVIALANTVGRLAVAWLSRLMRAPEIVVLGCLQCIFALTGLLLLPGASGALACLVLLAAGYGVVASGMPLLTRTLLQPGEFGRVFPIVLTGWGAAGFLAPRLSGQVRDATGSFDAVIIGCLVTSGLAAAVALALGLRGRTRS
jgi:MFS transporter, OFA family, oxalate/formate antiporter